MDAWERRARKLESKRQRMDKHGRSLLTAIRNAEVRRAKAARKKAAERERPGSP